MTDQNEPQSNHVEESGNDPFDLIRDARPASSVDPELISRAGADFRRRIGAETSRPILKVVEIDNTDRPNEDRVEAPVESRKSRVAGRYAYLGLVAAVILGALFIPPLFNRLSGPTAEESATVDSDGSTQEVDAAHRNTDGKDRDRRDNGKYRQNRENRRKSTSTTVLAATESAGEQDQITKPDEPGKTTTTAEETATAATVAKTEAETGGSDPSTTEPSKDSDTNAGASTSKPVSSTTASPATGSTTTTDTAGPGDDDSVTNTPVNASGFVANFENNQGLDQFRVGVFHRNMGSQELGQQPEIWGDSNAWHGGQWTGDHDLNCGLPTTQRTIESRKLVTNKEVSVDFALDEIVYVCRGHLMTSMGDVDGYSIAWFSPNEQFSRSEAKTVSWEVNVTDLKARQWWEVSIVPTGTEFLSTVGGLAGTANIDTYHPDAVIVGNGPFGGEVRMTVDGENQYDGSKGVCGQFALDPEGCANKMIRRTFSVTDNNDGTLTIDYGGLFTQTMSGQLPDSYQVFFKDHNYTPDKDGVPVGHTWHWDAISVR